MLPLTPRYWFLLSCTAAFLILSWFYLLPIIPSSTPEQIAQPPPPRPSASLASEPPPPTSLPIPGRRPQEAAGNETLGFQQILALSTARSWRTRGLEAAANLTGLQISIPPQPPISPEVIDAFIALGGPEARHPAHGAGIAWLAHLDLIKHSIQLDLDTVLIIEDDVDWDIAIKSQMMGIADAIRKLTRTPELEAAPYGRGWDVLWIGHCGEYWEEKWTDQTLVFDNPSVCPHDKYLGWAQPYISRLPDKQRSIYWSYNPVCSFAYALSREGARKVLHEAGHGQDEAFDVRVMGACKAKKLRCISVVPEVIHQYFPSAKFGVKSDVDIGNGEEKGPEDDAFEKVMGSTENILESARCHALWGKSCLKH